MSDLLNKISLQKEYNFRKQYDKDQTDIISGFSQREVPKIEGLQFYALQLFVKNFVNVNTTNTRLMLNWHTGTGKTEAMFAIALEFIKQNDFNFVTVITKPELKKEFIKRLVTNPEYEFTTKEQLEFLKNKKSQTQQFTQQTSDINVYEEKEIYNTVRNKIYKKFNFMGYKKLVNNVFKNNSHQIASQILELFDTFNGDYLQEALKRFSDNINFEFLRKLRGNLIFVDEAHHLYNSEKSNAYGITLKFVMDYLEQLPEQKTRLVLSTATIANGNPTEAIDMLNILVPNLRLNRDEYFKNVNDIPVIKSQTKIEEIGKVSEGYISFLVDTNRTNYPTYEFVGIKHKDIPYFKFIECEMSKYQQTTVINEFVNKPDLNEFKNKINQYAQYNISFPSVKHKDYGTITQDGIKLVKGANNSWKVSNGINYVNDRFIGDFLSIENLKKYSAKYYIR